MVAVWMLYGDLAAFVAAVLLIGWALGRGLRRLIAALEELRIQIEILPAQGVMFGNKPAGGEVVDLWRPKGDVA